MTSVPRLASGGGAGEGAKYLGPKLVKGPEVFLKHLVMGVTVKRFGGLALISAMGVYQ